MRICNKIPTGSVWRRKGCFSQCAVVHAHPGWLEGFCTNVDRQRELLLQNEYSHNSWSLWLDVTRSSLSQACEEYLWLQHFRRLFHVFGTWEDHSPSTRPCSCRHHMKRAMVATGRPWPHCREKPKYLLSPWQFDLQEDFFLNLDLIPRTLQEVKSSFLLQKKGERGTKSIWLIFLHRHKEKTPNPPTQLLLPVASGSLWLAECGSGES